MPVALTESDLSELLAALQAGEMTDTIRRSLEWVLQPLIEAEATAVIGAGPHERTETRVTQRNGHRPKLVSTAAGDVELAMDPRVPGDRPRHLRPVVAAA
jgi:putative transposase